MGERSTAASSDSAKPYGRASRRFSELISQGPTPIPDQAEVTAAISSVLVANDLVFEHQIPDHQVGASEPWRHAHTTPGARNTATGRAPNSTAPASNTSPAVNSRVDNRGGSGGCDNSNVNTSVEGRSSSSNGNGNGRIDRGDGGAANGGGLLDWALWPLWGTIDALKWAGGTVNDVAVAPVMRLANPWGLAGSILTTAKAFTPQRARDLARVVGNGALNAVGLVRSPAGGELLQSSGQAVESFSMAMSSPAGRQLLVDSATGFVKLAEALDTPEANNAIRQGAVVLARGMDALASRHSKIFMKDLAEVLIRLVGLANTGQAVDMAAEFTANIAHALEMEHVAGMSRVAADALNPGSAVGGEGTTLVIEHPEHGELHADNSIGGVPGGGNQDYKEAASSSGYNVHTSEEFVREAQLEQAGEEGRSVGGIRGDARDRSSTVGGENSEIVVENDRNDMSRGEQNNIWTDIDRGVASTDAITANITRGSYRINRTPIRQADLAGNTPLRILRPTSAAKPSSTIPNGEVGNGSTASGSDSASDTRGNLTHSAPPTPRYSSTQYSVVATAAVSTMNGSGMDGTGCRRRANSHTGAAGSSIGGSGNFTDSRLESVNPETLESTTAQSKSDLAENEDGGRKRPPVEYVRDGRAILPRFSGQTLAPMLRRQPVGLGLQLEAPSAGSWEETLGRPARLWLQEISRRSRGIMTGGDSRDTIESAPEERTNHSETPTPSATARALNGWKQLVFAALLLFFAGNGFIHQYRSVLSWMLTTNKHSSMPTRQPSSAFRTTPTDVVAPIGFGVNADGLESGGHDGGSVPKGRFREAILPPKCQDTVSGTLMVVWATPSGPCLSLAEDFGDSTGGTGGWFGAGGGEIVPGCAVSFRICSAQEIVQKADVGVPPDVGHNSPGLDDLQSSVDHDRYDVSEL